MSERLLLNIHTKKCFGASDEMEVVSGYIQCQKKPITLKKMVWSKPLSKRFPGA